MKQSIGFWMIVVILAIVLVGGFVFWSNSSTGLGFFSASTSTPSKEIHVAFISSLSGEASVWGRSLQKGFDFALTEINDNGGINGQKIVADYEDDQCNATAGLSAFNDAVAVKNNSMVMGTVCSSVTFAVAPLTQKNHVLYMASGATHPDATKQGDLIFRLWVSDAYEAKIIANFADQNLHQKSFAVLYVKDNPAGLAIKDTFAQQVKNNGGIITALESYAGTEKDFHTAVTKVLATSPNSVYVMSTPGQMALLINTLRSSGFKGSILAYGPAIYTNDVAAAVSDKSNVFFAIPKEIQQTAFWSNYEQKTGEKADLLTALGYDSLKILENGLKQCSTNTTCLKNYLLSLKNYPSARGPVTFDSNRDLNEVPFEIKQLE